MFSTSIRKALLSCICGLMLPATGLTDAEYEAIEAYEASFLELLGGIHDQKSADAAACVIRTHPHAHTAARVLHPQWWTDGNENPPLAEAYFHGSEALAEALGFQVEDALLPSPLTPDITKEIQADLVRNLVKPGDRKEAESLIAQNKGLRPDLLATIPREVANALSGGCGFSPEYAWVVHADSYQKAQFVATLLINYGFTGIYKCLQRIEFKGKRRFLVSVVTLLRNGRKYEVEQWFDISVLAPVHPEAMRKQAANDLHELASELHSALFSIWDEESARGQVPAIASLYEKCQQTARICEERQSIWMLWMNAFDIPRRERIASQLINIEKENAYGSDTLLRLLQKLRLPLYQ